MNLLHVKLFQINQVNLSLLVKESRLLAIYYKPAFEALTRPIADQSISPSPRAIPERK